MRSFLAIALLSLLPATVAAKESLPDVFGRVSESVVVVRTVSTGPTLSRERRATVMLGIGSGVIVSPEGLILTAAHVIQAADDVVVEFPDGSKVTADIVSSRPGIDLALLKLRRVPEGLVVARLGDSDEVRVGDSCFVVGAPLGVTHTLTVGHVSARREKARFTGALWRSELFQTDAAINQGNSGGPMFSRKGEVIGIVSHIISPDASSIGLGFAVTSNLARKLMLESPSFWSGIEGIMMGPELAAALNVPGGVGGILVQKVALLSPAYHLGVQAGRIRAMVEGQEILLGGDVLLEVMGVACTPETQAELRKRVASVPLGGEIHLRALRGGEILTLSTLRKN